MSLDDLRNKINEKAAKAYVDKRPTIMREGEAHEESLKVREEEELARSMKNLEKTMKEMKNSGGGKLHGR